MNAELPDVSLSDAAPMPSPLAWVGMQGIDLPVLVEEQGYTRELHAQVDVQVDLPRPEVKGIHMSRLYRLLDRLHEGAGMTSGSLKSLLTQMVASQTDCGSGNVRLRIAFDLLIRRPALVTEGLSGWKSYPVQVDAAIVDGQFHCRSEVRVGYSSTCPCSAALSRQVVEQRFRESFQNKATVASDEVALWLRDNASSATPHSQRSVAQVSVDVDEASQGLGLLPLIDRIEGALQTPLQTGVKRADEQAFATLNGQNLMFVEDAARRIEAALNHLQKPEVHVCHSESLHGHDAVAWALPNSGAV